MHFARTLRAAGLPVGPGKVLDAVDAVQRRRHHRPARFLLDAARRVRQPAATSALIFDQAFHVFWRNPELLKKMMGLVLPEMRIDAAEDEGDGDDAAPRRGAAPGHRRGGRSRGDRDRDRRGDDLLRPRAAARHGFREDVDSTSWRRAKAAIARHAPAAARTSPTRRFAPDPRGARADMRATLRAALRSGGLIELKRQAAGAGGRRRWSCCATSPAR